VLRVVPDLRPRSDQCGTTQAAGEADDGSLVSHGPASDSTPADVIGPATPFRSDQPYSDFAQYVTLRLPALLRFGHALTGNPHDASDLVQDALERVGARWSSIDHDRGSPDAYVRRAMLNARTSRWRRRRRETLVAEIPDTMVHARDRLDDQPLWIALQALPPRQRAVIVLRYYEDLSEAEIASTLGISAGTVKSQASRAMAMLRQQLSSQGSISTGGAL
jgi:RNA polymerase sigma-70 factor (sigma-E family)